jgi:Flp pilus assembly protein TadD
MAKVAIKQKLFGQAIRLTNKALSLEPTDRDAIAIQGEAMVEAGAVPRARNNLAKLQKLCAGPCPQAAALSAAIARGPALAAATPNTVKKVN